MNDMRELKMLMQILMKSMRDTNIQYEFFHSEDDLFGDIRPSTKIVNEDKNFTVFANGYGDLEFANNSPFFRGCIKISLKE